MNFFARNILVAVFALGASIGLFATSHAALHDTEPLPVMFTKTAKAECNRVTYTIKVMGSGTLAGVVPINISDTFQTGGQLFGNINVTGGAATINPNSGGFDISLFASAGQTTTISYVVEFDTSMIPANRQITNQAVLTSTTFPGRSLLSDDPGPGGETDATLVTLPPANAPQCVQNNNSLISIQQFVKRVTDDGCGNLTYHVYLKGVSDTGQAETITLKDLFPSGMTMTSGPDVVNSTGITSTTITHPPFQSWQADIEIPSFSDSTTGGNFLIELEFKVKLDPNQISADGIVKNQVFLSALGGSLDGRSDDASTSETDDATTIKVDVEEIRKCQGPTTGEDTSTPKFPQCFSLKPEFDCSDDGRVLVTLNTTSSSGFVADEMDVVCTTPGVTARPLGIYLPGGRQTLVLDGAVPGQTVNLTSTGVQIGGGSVAGTDLCCSGSAEVKIPAQICKPELVVTKDCDPAVASTEVEGWTAQCRITVTGTRLFAGTPVNVVENFTGGGTIVNITPADPLDPWTCGATPNTSLNCSIDGGDLMASGGTSVINATIAFTNSDSAKDAVNCAIGTYGSDEENAISTPKACDDFGGIKVEKRFSEHECSAGGACNFEIILTNTSNYSAFNGPIAIKEEMTGLDLNILSVTPQLCNPDPATTPFACVANVSLAAGASQTYVFNAYFPLGAMDNESKTVKNCATTAPPPADTSGEWWSDYFESVPTENSCSEAFACGFACHMNEADAEDLTVVKEVKQDENCKPGGQCVYTITVQNTGPSALTSPITLAENIPAGSSLVSVGPLPWSCAPTSTTDELSCAYPPGNLASGASLSFDITLAIPADFAGDEIKNCVGFLVTTSPRAASRKASPLFGKSDKNPQLDLLKYLAGLGYSKSPSGKITINGEKFSRRGAVVRKSAIADKQSCVSTPVGETNDDTAGTSASKGLNIKKTGPEFCQAGEACTFTITLSNPDPVNDFNGPVTIGDNFSPANAQIVSISPDICGGNTPMVTPFSCTPTMQVPAGGSVDVDVSVLIPALIRDGVNEFKNCATLDAEHSASGEAQESCATIQKGESLLSLEKTGPDSCEFQQPCDYVITIKTGGRPFSGEVFIYDDVTPMPVNVTAITPNVCGTQVSSEPFSCVVNLNLAANDQMQFTVTFDATGEGSEVVEGENCISIGLKPDGMLPQTVYSASELGQILGGSTHAIMDQVCARFNQGPKPDAGSGGPKIDTGSDGNAGNLSISKSKSGRCSVPDNKCDFEIVIANTGSTPMVVPPVRDVVLNLNQNITSVSSPWSCVNNSGYGLCTANPPLTLQPGAQTTISIATDLPDGVRGIFENCASIKGEQPAAIDGGVAALQRALSNQGFNPGPIDGQMGKQTRRAIKDAERAFRLPVTGESSPELLGMLAGGSTSGFADDNARDNESCVNFQLGLSEAGGGTVIIPPVVHNRRKSRLDEFHKRFKSAQHDRATTRRIDSHDRRKSRLDEFHKRFKSAQHDRATTRRIDSHDRMKSRLDEFHKRFKSAQHDRATTRRIDSHDRRKSRLDEFHKKYKSAQHDGRVTRLRHDKRRSLMGAFHKRFKSSEHDRATTRRIIRHDRGKSRLEEFHRKYKSAQHDGRVTRLRHDKRRSLMGAFHKRFKSSEHDRATTRRIIRHDRGKSRLDQFHKKFKSAQHDRRVTRLRHDRKRSALQEHNRAKSRMRQFHQRFKSSQHDRRSTGVLKVRPPRPQPGRPAGPGKNLKLPKVLN